MYPSYAQQQTGFCILGMGTTFLARGGDGGVENLAGMFLLQSSLPLVLLVAGVKNH